MIGQTINQLRWVTQNDLRIGKNSLRSCSTPYSQLRFGITSLKHSLVTTMKGKFPNTTGLTVRLIVDTIKGIKPQGDKAGGRERQFPSHTRKFFK